MQPSRGFLPRKFCKRLKPQSFFARSIRFFPSLYFAVEIQFYERWVKQMFANTDATKKIKITTLSQNLFSKKLVFESCFFSAVEILSCQLEI